MGTRLSDHDADCRPAHRAYFDPSAPDQPVGEIINSLSTVTDCPVDEIEPLAETFDPTSLERLLTHAAASSDGASVGLEFTLGGWTITVGSDGCVLVCSCGVGCALEERADCGRGRE
ncbi:HalOD1 output domain-containing protein [Natronolimnohabitans innermongolicus]|uniref:Halobacterial output domain-containing protein n=1 Tax=Natronolimnohabitans innermongolicus JCM 12255 TaxID=1227499 RepID=L9XB74_9EURY|nr:HalOD1 output domain-containing protein [Natronolimnohabitans innermongolicus]ELY58965.1 hypothetical protein C493_05950 [Natronolimnohabitans innermongolicus JCM 12255]